MNIEQKMTSLEIAQLTGKQHKHVMRDIEKMLFELELGGPNFGHTYKTTQGKILPCFLLPRREVEILITGYSIKLRAKVIDRLKEVEQELVKKQEPQKALPGNYKEALLALVEAEEEKERQQLLIEQQKPAVEFCNQISQAKNDLLIREFSKVLSNNNFVIGEKNLFKYLRNNNILMANNQPYQQYINNGYFNVVTRLIQTNHGTVTKYTPKVTGRGQVALAKRILKDLKEA